MAGFFGGVDVGAAAIKAVVINREREVLGFAIRKTTTNLGELAEDAFSEALEVASVSRDEVTYIIATGFGRDNVSFADEMRTELSCHAKGGHHHFKNLKEPMAIVDIGGQDNKIIKLDSQGKMTNFKMNRKCAAGTGAFLEEIAHKLDVPLDEMDKYARRATKDIELGSFCTVFTSTEILGMIKEGETKENMVKGALISVAKRILEMEILGGVVVLTGGVIGHNPLIAEILEKQLNVDVHIPPNPQIMGAFGASLLALERHDSRTGSPGVD
jgi:predicted CoA-substrate-specific enzyme activase